MTEWIRIKGVQTNNLKNIDVSIKKNAINLIVGPSGSGKSSLAYSTIAQIGLHELGAMYHDGVNEPEYKVESYENMVVTVPIPQLNRNSNTHSTIGTYFSISTYLAKVFSSLLNVQYDYFVLNKAENVCPKCMGLGYIKQLDPNKIIDYNKKIYEVPIRCWTKNKDFYRQILECLCRDYGISTEKKFRQLSDEQKRIILFEKSEKKYKIVYKVTNHTSSRTTHYFGPLTETPMLKTFSPSAIFYSEIPCDECEGQKFEVDHRNVKLCDYSIGEILLMPFEKLPKWIAKLKETYDCSEIEFSLNQIENFARKAVELNLGYLFLNRTIPSLSGGELQRLRLVQVFNSQLTDLLIVLDEPLAGLSAYEKEVVYKNILMLKNKHTVLIVDHHELFVNEAEQIYALGDAGGIKGGKLIDVAQYLKAQRSEFAFEKLPRTKEIHVNIRSSVYGYKGVDIRLLENNLNLITGPSGVGKSTLLREYLPQKFDDYLYINQRPILGSVRSNVATVLNISNRISSIFTKKFKTSKTLFSNLSSTEGMCKSCQGTGIITFGSVTQSQIMLECKDCKGSGFDKRLARYKIKDFNIQDVYNLTIDEAIEYFDKIDKQIVDTLKLAQELFLGHLKLREKTYNLSGGENIRIKLVQALTSKRRIIGIDEPFKGLNCEEIYRIISMLKRIAKNNKTIVVVDHEESCIKYFSQHIILINEDGILHMQ